MSIGPVNPQQNLLPAATIPELEIEVVKPKPGDDSLPETRPDLSVKPTVDDLEPTNFVVPALTSPAEQSGLLRVQEATGTSVHDLIKDYNGGLENIINSSLATDPVNDSPLMAVLRLQAQRLRLEAVWGTTSREHLYNAYIAAKAYSFRQSMTDLAGKLTKPDEQDLLKRFRRQFENYLLDYSANQAKTTVDLCAPNQFFMQPLVEPVVAKNSGDYFHLEPDVDDLFVNALPSESSFATRARRAALAAATAALTLGTSGESYNVSRAVASKSDVQALLESSPIYQTQEPPLATRPLTLPKSIPQALAQAPVPRPLLISYKPEATNINLNFAPWLSSAERQTAIGQLDTVVNRLRTNPKLAEALKQPELKINISSEGNSNQKDLALKLLEEIIRFEKPLMGGFDPAIYDKLTKREAQVIWDSMRNYKK